MLQPYKNDTEYRFGELNIGFLCLKTMSEVHSSGKAAIYLGLKTQTQPINTDDHRIYSKAIAHLLGNSSSSSSFVSCLQLIQHGPLTSPPLLEVQ